MQPETDGKNHRIESTHQGIAGNAKGSRSLGPLRRRLFGILAALQRFLFGDDVFISYSRRDASDYALALAAKLTTEKLSCYLDQWGTRPGNKLPDELIASLKRSTIMVLLGTPAAAQSESVAQEVTLFLETGRSLVPVNFAGALEQADYYGKIEGLAAFADSEEALRTAAPAGALVERIVNAEGFTSRAKRLRQTFWATAVVMVLLVAAGAVITNYYAGRAGDQRRASRVSKLTSESIVALKQERNPTKAYSIAAMALEADSTSVQAWGALLDARYSQIFRWEKQYFSVPFSTTFTLSGILGAADLSGDGKTLAAGSWDPYLARMWSLDGEEVISLTGFAGPIWRIQFSPNDSLLLVAAKTGPARIYDRKGELRCRLSITEQILTCAEFSKDGKQVITGFEDGTATVWDAFDGTETVRLISEYPAGVSSASFSPDGRRLLTTDHDGTVIIWDEQGNYLFEECLGGGYMGPGPLNSAVFAPDGLRIVGVSNNGRTEIWDANDGRRLEDIRPQEPWKLSVGFELYSSPVLGASWSPDSYSLVTYSGSGRLMLMQPGLDGVITRYFDAHDNRVRGARFSTDGQHLVSYGDDNTIKLWTAGGTPMLELGEFTGPVLVAGISRDGTLVYGSSWDGTVKIFPIKGHPLTTYSGQTGISKVEITPDGTKILSISTTGQAVLWQRDGTPIRALEPKAGWLYDMVLSPDGDLAFIHADSGGVLWDLKSLQWKRLAIDSAVTGARFFPDGQRLLTGSVDRKLQIWTREGEPTSIVGVSEESIRDLDLSSDGTQVAAALDSGKIELWSVKDMRKLWLRAYHNNEPVNSVRFSSKGDLVVSAGSGDFRAILCDTGGNILEVLRHSNDVLSAVFSKDDKFILTYSSDGSTKLWSREGELQAELRTSSTVNRAVLSTDMKFIATASNDGKVRLWDIEGTLLATLPAGIRSVNWIALAEEGDWLVSTSSDGRTFGWNLRNRSREDSLSTAK